MLGHLDENIAVTSGEAQIRDPTSRWVRAVFQRITSHKDAVHLVATLCPTRTNEGACEGRFRVLGQGLTPQQIASLPYRERLKRRHSQEERLLFGREHIPHKALHEGHDARRKGERPALAVCAKLKVDGYDSAFRVTFNRHGGPHVIYRHPLKVVLPNVGCAEPEV